MKIDYNDVQLGQFVCLAFLLVVCMLGPGRNVLVRKTWQMCLAEESAERDGKLDSSDNKFYCNDCLAERREREEQLRARAEQQAHQFGPMTRLKRDDSDPFSCK